MLTLPYSTGTRQTLAVTHERVQTTAAMARCRMDGQGDGTGGRAAPAGAAPAQPRQWLTVTASRMTVGLSVSHTMELASSVAPPRSLRRK